MRLISKRRFSRRAMLRGAAGAAVLAPFVPYLNSHAEAEGTPQRLFLLWTPNGSIHSMWKPTGSETSWTFGEVARPLERHRDDLVFISGLNKVPIRPDGGGSENNHCRGLGCTWTAEAFASGTFRDSNGNLVGYNRGTSVDQYIAQRLAPPTPFRSIELGLHAGREGSPTQRMIYQGDGMPLSPEEDPVRAFDRIFAGVTEGDTGEAERIRAEKRSVIDYVSASLSRVRGQVGVEDRRKIDAHLETVRAVERRIADVATATCAPPARETATDGATILSLHGDLIAAAFACDLTRFASIQLDHPASGTTWRWLGHTRFLHAMGHFDQPGDREAFIEADEWLHGAVAEILDAFVARDLMDSSLMVWAQELGRSDAHFLGSVPFVLAGRCGGHFRTGRFLDYGGAPSESPSGGEPHSKLLTSVCHAFGLDDVTRYGNPEWSGEGPLPGLR